MSLLQQDTRALDDAARGDDYTKGSSHVVWTSIVAAILVSAAIAVYVFAGQKPPVATGEIVRVWAHPLHTVTAATDINGEPTPQETYDQVLVFAQVRLHNQSKTPLFLHEILTNASLEDGIHSSYAASPTDFERLFIAHPELDNGHGKPLARETTIDPGQTQEGVIVSAFHLTKDEWAMRKSVNFTFGFRYQPNLVVEPKVELIEQ